MKRILLSVVCSVLVCVPGFSIADDGPGGGVINLICYVDGNPNCALATVQFAAENPNLYNTSCNGCEEEEVVEDLGVLCRGRGTRARIANADLTIPFAMPYPKGPQGSSGKETVVSTGSSTCGMEVNCLTICYEKESGGMVCQTEVPQVQ